MKLIIQFLWAFVITCCLFTLIGSFIIQADTLHEIGYVFSHIAITPSIVIAIFYKQIWSLNFRRHLNWIYWFAIYTLIFFFLFTSIFSVLAKQNLFFTDYFSSILLLLFVIPIGLAATILTHYLKTNHKQTTQHTTLFEVASFILLSSLTAGLIHKNWHAVLPLYQSFIRGTFFVLFVYPLIHWTYKLFQGQQYDLLKSSVLSLVCTYILTQILAFFMAIFFIGPPTTIETETLIVGLTALTYELPILVALWSVMTHVVTDLLQLDDK